MSYIVNFERRYDNDTDYYTEIINLLENKYNFPIYINIKEIISGITNTGNDDCDGILSLCKDDFCLSDSFLDNLKYTGDNSQYRKRYYYSDYSFIRIPLKKSYNKYVFDDFKILLYPKQKLSVHIFTNSDNSSHHVFYLSGWIKFQVDRYPN